MAEYAQRPLVETPINTQLVFHWMSIDGKTPKTAENLAPKVVRPERQV